MRPSQRLARAYELFDELDLIDDQIDQICHSRDIDPGNFEYHLDKFSENEEDSLLSLLRDKLRIQEELYRLQKNKRRKNDPTNKNVEVVRKLNKLLRENSNINKEFVSKLRDGVMRLQGTNMQDSGMAYIAALKFLNEVICK
jgi:hypothetical protein